MNATTPKALTPTTDDPPRSLVDDFAVAALGPLLADAIRQRWETDKPWNADVVGVLAYQAALGAMKARKQPEMWGEPII